MIFAFCQQPPRSKTPLWGHMRGGRCRFGFSRIQSLPASHSLHLTNNKSFPKAAVGHMRRQIFFDRRNIFSRFFFILLCAFILAFMELKLNLNFNQILGLIQQLSDSEKARLASTIQSELASKKPSETKKIQDLILSAPTWGEEELSEYKNVRAHINKSRIVWYFWTLRF